MFRQGPSELPETHYKYKLNISLKGVGAYLELKKKKRKRTEKERGRDRGERERNHLKANENKAGFYKGRFPPTDLGESPIRLRSEATCHHY